MARARAVYRGSASTKRVGLIDELRGIVILGVVVYHLLYDLTGMYGFDIPLFYSSWVDIVRDAGAGMFIFISGAMCRFSRNNLRRGAACLAVALGLSLVSYLMMPDQFIAFGILHNLGASMLLYWLLRPLLERIPWLLGLLVMAALFVMTLSVGRGTIGLPGLFNAAIPDTLYQTKFLFPFGLPDAAFQSADYYPLLPWFFLFLAGSYLGAPLRAGSFPEGVYDTRFRSLAFLGKHTLIIYLAHQPIILGALEVIFRLKEMLIK